MQKKDIIVKVNICESRSLDSSHLNSSNIGLINVIFTILYAPTTTY